MRVCVCVTVERMDHGVSEWVKRESWRWFGLVAVVRMREDYIVKRVWDSVS